MSVVGARARAGGARELKVLERDTAKLERVQAPFPRITYDEAVQLLQAKGLPIEWGGDFGGPDETALSSRVRPARHGPPLPVGDQGVLHEAGPGTARARARRRRARAGRLRRDHRRRRAARRPRPAARSGSRSTSCRRRPSSGTSTCAATARCRTAASAWASSGWSPGSAASSTSARRFRIPRMLYGCIRKARARGLVARGSDESANS